MEQEIRAEIRRFIVDSPANRLPDESGPYFDEPLVGFAAFSDPLFSRFQEIIGPFHQPPGALFEATFGAAPAAGTVICWILPIAEEVRKSNRRQSQWPSREWALTRSHGEALNRALREHLVGWLAALGQRALAPQLAPGWRELADSPVGIASTWSERHAAYAAGLGTFSLNDGLITRRGIAHRCGSVLTDLVLPPTPRSYSGRADHCLYHRDGSCAACVARCPADALSREGHDKAKCRAYVYGATPQMLGAVYGVTATGCGLCQTKVPCEERIPRVQPGDAVDPGRP